MSALGAIRGHKEKTEAQRDGIWQGFSAPTPSISRRRAANKASREALKESS